MFGSGGLGRRASSSRARPPPSPGTAHAPGMERGNSSGVDPLRSPALATHRASAHALQQHHQLDQAGQGASSTSTGVPGRTEGGPHLRRRSSLMHMHSTLQVDDEPPTPKTPASTTMERVSSLTTFMGGGGSVGGGGGSKGARPGSSDREKEKRAARDGPAAGGSARVLLHRRRLYTSLTRLVALMSLTLLVLYFLKSVFAPLLPGAVSTSDDSRAARWFPKVGGYGIFDTFETVPYPLKTHPRTPRPKEQGTLSLADYLTTRLGSHFAFPSANLPQRSTRGSQLWLTSATNQSIHASNRHLGAFVTRLETTGGSMSAHDGANGIEEAAEKRPLENADQRGAQRVLVTLCLDEGCMDACRRDPQLYCFGGFIKPARGSAAAKRRGKRSIVGRADVHEPDHAETTKLQGLIDTLESGRRALWIDDGTYFKQDPVPYMGDLSSYDLQIPESWTTGTLNSGLAYFNPTQHVISLLRKVLSITLLPLERDRLGWASTNLLLDPTGQQRDFKHVPPMHHAAALDENLFLDEAHDKLAHAGYGQVEFESPWDGGIDVRVLDPKRFRTSTGRLGKRAFDFERARERDTLYWHCLCCGDSYTNDYIAGALGFHQPAVTYSIPTPHTLPSLPLVLKTSALGGTRAEIRFAMSLLLQIAHDAGRVFVPPVTATIVPDEPNDDEGDVERYIWRVFPVALWAHPSLAPPSASGVKLPPSGAGGTPGHRVEVREPGYVQHAIAHLRQTHLSSPAALSPSSSSPTAKDALRLVTELEEPLVLDMRELETLGKLIAGLTKPFWSTERVVVIEGLEKYRGREGWDLRAEFEDLSMCRVREGKAVEGDAAADGAAGTCEQLCPL
ncbi:uncharacterized protein JCM10292_004679 [Rhodotorula paludigena]|uniref:uncharacterized protein n=1 Tax=Rhodotorula paludigena TaxID=86838 RepID=UPI003178859D